MRRVLPVCLVLCFLASATPAEAKDEEAQLAQAKELVATLATQRKAKDAAGLLESFKTTADLHNGLEDKGLRGKLQKEVGSVLKDDKLEDAHAAAISTLGSLNDPKGAYKQLKKLMPDAKEEKMTEQGGQVLAAVAQLAPDSALKALEELAEKAKDHDAGAAAITALGHYRESKKRVAVLENLVKLLQRFKPAQSPDKNIGEATLKRWEKLGGPILGALNRITGQKVRDPDEWIALYKDHKKKPAGLFVED